MLKAGFTQEKYPKDFNMVKVKNQTPKDKWPPFIRSYYDVIFKK